MRDHAAIGASGGNDINVTLSGVLTASAASGTGGIFVGATGNLAVGTVNAGTGNIEIQANGNITSSSSSISGANLSLTVTGRGSAIGASTAATDIDVALTGTLTASAAIGNGGIFITETGDMSVASINAGGGNVVLESTGTIKDTMGADEVTDITAANLTLRNSTGIGTSTGDALNLDVTNLTITATSGNVFITEADGLGVRSINICSNDLNLRAILGDITSTTSSITADDVTLTVSANNAAIGASGAGMINLTLTGKITAAALSGNGGIFLNETNDLVVASLNPGTGTVELQSSGVIKNAASNDTVVDIAGGDLTFRTATFLGASATDALNLSVANVAITDLTVGDAFLTEANGIGPGTMNIGPAQNLNLVAFAGSITNHASAVIVNNLILTASGPGGAIGASGAANDINVVVSGTITALSGSGGIYLTETGPMSILSIDAGNLELESDSTITEANGSANEATDLTGGSITFRNATRLGNSVADALNLNVSSLNITALSGKVFLTEANGTGIGNVNIGANTLRFKVLTGSVTNDTSSVIAGDLYLDANGPGATIGAAGVANHVNVQLSGTLNVTATNGIFLSETGDMSIVTVATAGNVELQANNGNIADLATPIIAANLSLTVSTNGKSIGSAANNIDATATGALSAFAAAGDIFVSETDVIAVGTINAGSGLVRLTTPAGIDESADDDNVNITTTGTLELNARNAIGAAGGTEPLDLQVGTLGAHVTTNPGGIYVKNTGTVTVADVDTTSGDIDIQSSGSIVATAIDANTLGNVSLTATNGNITLTHVTAAGGGTLTITASNASLLNSASDLVAGNAILTANGLNASIGASGASTDINLTLSGTLTASAPTGLRVAFTLRKRTTCRWPPSTLALG